MAIPTLLPEGARVLSRPDEPEKGWTVCDYRGARLHCWGIDNRLEFPGHPFDGMRAGNSALLAHVVDCWLDGQQLPQGYGVAPRAYSRQG